MKITQPEHNNTLGYKDLDEPGKVVKALTFGHLYLTMQVQDGPGLSTKPALVNLEDGSTYFPPYQFGPFVEVTNYTFKVD